MIKLTEKEKEIINKLNDPLYTVEFIEEWVNRNDNLYANCIAALQAMGAQGYYTAVKNMAKMEKVDINEK